MRYSCQPKTAKNRESYKIEATRDSVADAGDFNLQDLEIKPAKSKRV